MLTIEHLGLSSFKIKEGDITVVTDPFDPKMVGLKWSRQEADIVTVSHNHGDHNHIQGVNGLENTSAVMPGKPSKDAPFVVYGPGEYEVRGVRITGYGTYHDNKQGAERGDNTVYMLEVGEFVVVHMGDIGHDLTDELVEEISSAHILMIPVGGVYTVDHELAEKITAAISPNIVVPMHYKVRGMASLFGGLDGVDKFISEFGEENLIKSEKLKVKSVSELDQEQVRVWVRDQ